MYNPSPGTVKSYDMDTAAVNLRWIIFVVFAHNHVRERYEYFGKVQ